jgi:hypothetical protein
VGRKLARPKGKTLRPSGFGLLSFFLPFFDCFFSLSLFFKDTQELETEGATYGFTP